MSLSQMQVFNSYLMPVLAEIYPQEIQKFNAASNGAIVLSLLVSMAISSVSRSTTPCTLPSAELIAMQLKHPPPQPT